MHVRGVVYTIGFLKIHINEVPYELVYMHVRGAVCGINKKK